MRIFQDKFKDGQGKTREAPNWSIEFKDTDGRKRRLSCFRDKDATSELSRRVRKLVALKVEQMPPDLEMNEYLRKLPERMLKKFVNWGLLSSASLSSRKPLQQHVNDWRDWLESKQRSKVHIKKSVRNVLRVVKALNATNFWDLTSDNVQAYVCSIHEGKENLSLATVNHIITSIKGFFTWAVDKQRIGASPVADLEKYRAKTDVRRQRRALTLDEQRLLLTSTLIAPKSFGLLGSERALLYTFALKTGIRSGEARKLLVSDLNLGSKPSVQLRAKITKNSENATIPLSADIADWLREHTRKKLPSAAVFRMPGTSSVARMLKKDLELCGINYVDESGLVADFHALRHTFATNLVRRGAHPRLVQKLARHASIELTMETYSHLSLDDYRGAIDGLPDYNICLSNVSATGTDGKNHSLPNSPFFDEDSGRSAPLRGKKHKVLEELSKDAEVSKHAGKPSTVDKKAGGLGGTRTRDTGIMSPLDNDTQHLSTQGDMEEGKEDSLPYSLLRDTNDPNLTALIVSWPTLPEAIKSAILAIVRDHKS